MSGRFPLCFGRAGLLALVCVALLPACADIAPPPGGEVDKSGPALLGSVPESGTLNVPSGNVVTFYFSERVVEPKDRRCIYISPRPTVEPEVRWKADRIIVTLADSFQPDQTYIVTLGSAITDLRNNKLDSAISIAFSTGPTIDSGAISGHVFNETGKPQSGAMVALYDIGDMTDSSVHYDSLYARYLSSSNAEGYFTLRYLPEKIYRLIAFEDKNGDDLFNPLREAFALPDRQIEVGGTLPLGNLIMRMTSYDTGQVQILAASQTSDGLVKMRLSDKIDPAPLKDRPGLIVLKAITDSAAVYGALAARECDLTETDLLHAYFGPLAEGTYAVEMALDTARPVMGYRELAITDPEDKTPPSVAAFHPGDNSVLPQDLELGLTFSEPLDTNKLTAETFTLWLGESIRVPVAWRWSDHFHLSLQAVDSIVPGAYLLRVTEFDVMDPAGNLMGDSLTEYGFSVLGTDSLGSISGEIAINLPGKTEDPVVLHFENVRSRQVFDLRVADRSFFVEVPAGKYLLSGFIDSDDNGRHGRGMIVPYRYSETESSFPDTIGVRARFETAGIQLTFE